MIKKIGIFGAKIGNDKADDVKTYMSILYSNEKLMKH